MKHEKTRGASETIWSRALRWLRAAKAYLESDGVIPWILNIIIAFAVIKLIVFPLLGLAFGSELPVVAVMSGSMEHRAADGLVCGRTVPDAYDHSLDMYWNLCGGWYESQGITKAMFDGYPLSGGFNKGDIMVILGPTRGTIGVGDVIVFQSRESYPIIHRVIAVHETATGRVYETKGDHNPDQIQAYVLPDGHGGYSQCQSQGRASSCALGAPVLPSMPGAVVVLDETRVSADAVVGHAVMRIPWLGWVKIGVTDLFDWITGKPLA